MMTIAFDFDGTLLDSSSRHTDLLRDILTLTNTQLPPYSLDSFIRFKADGFSTRQFLEQYINDDFLIKKICNAWVSHIEDDVYLKSDLLYPDAFWTLKHLKDKGYDLLLVSSRQYEDRLLRQVANHGLKDFFCHIACVSPKNAVEEKTKVLKIHKADCMIGDTEVDWKSAEIIGIPFFVLNRGFRSRKYWDKNKIKSFGGLDEIVRCFC